MDRDRLEAALVDRYDADDAIASVVARQARDLADAGQYATDLETELTVEAVLENLDDAPDDHDLIERWNWWLGALELSHGGYDRFSVREDLA